MLGASDSQEIVKTLFCTEQDLKNEVWRDKIRDLRIYWSYNGYLLNGYFLLENGNEKTQGKREGVRKRG